MKGYAFSEPRIKPVDECHWTDDCRQTASEAVTTFRTSDQTQVCCVDLVCRWHGQKAREMAATLDHVRVTVSPIAAPAKRTK